MADFTVQDKVESLPDLENVVTAWLADYPEESAGVVVPIYNALDDVLACIESLGKTTPDEVPVLLIDDASTDEALPAAVEEVAARFGFCSVRKPQNSGFVNTINLAFAWFKARDVVIINSDTIFPQNWYKRLRHAAYVRPNTATATPLTNHGTIATVPDWRTPSAELVDGLSLAESDARIEASSLRLYPVVPTSVGHCTYFRRAALDDIGYFDQSFSPGYGEEIDFSRRAILAGYINVIADDLFIHHKHNRSFSQLGSRATVKLQDQHHPILTQRYPTFAEEVHQIRHAADSQLLSALAQARSALLGPDASTPLTPVREQPKSLIDQAYRAVAILRTDGLAGLRAEIDQYMRWRRLQ